AIVDYSISENRIFANGGLGIDLLNDDVTPNDPGDVDGDLRGLQNFPELNPLATGATAVSGVLNSLPNETFSIYVYANSACDPSGYGEGEIFLGQGQTTSDAAGKAIFNVTVPTLQLGQFITATASSGATSEFSRCVQVTGGPPPPQLRYPNANGTVSVARTPFSWFAVPNARRYRIQVATDANFVNLLVDTMEASTVKAPYTFMPDGYFWRVQTQDTNNVWGAFSEVRYYEYVLMQSPIHNGHSYGAFPIFTWNAYPHARRYQLEILIHRFDVLRPVSVCTYTYRVLSSRPCGLPNGLPYGDYYWRVNIDLGSGFITSPINWALSVNIRNMPTPQPISPIGTVVSSPQTLHVRALIDGRSQLVVQGNSVYWHHFDFAAPGRHGFVNEPTFLNTQAWFPTWPDVPDAENRDCACASSTYTGVPILPATGQTVGLTVVQARESVTIVQQPSQDNQYTLIVEFNDNLPVSSDWYEIDLSYGESANQPGMILFQWSAATGATEYEVQATLDPAFRNLYLVSSTYGETQTEMGMFTTPGRYYWRVRAWFDGKPGIWATASFDFH
ncbi:MAG: hypothetical protein K8I30_13630, partial [Anaerolineae bacterium]|nr:hypothetical protein [Anaerolineae bacterium]